MTDEELREALTRAGVHFAAIDILVPHRDEPWAAKRIEELLSR